MNNRLRNILIFIVLVAIIGIFISLKNSKLDVVATSGNAGGLGYYGLKNIVIRDVNGGGSNFGYGGGGALTLVPLPVVYPLVYLTT